MPDHHLTPDQLRSAESRGPYARVFVALVVLTALEYGVAYRSALMNVPFGAQVGALTCLATIYAFLVAWYFMHLKYEGRWITLMLVPVGVLTVVVLAGLTPDIAFHRTGFYQSTAVADR